VRGCLPSVVLPRRYARNHRGAERCTFLHTLRSPKFYRVTQIASKRRYLIQVRDAPLPPKIDAGPFGGQFTSVRKMRGFKDCLMAASIKLVQPQLVLQPFSFPSFQIHNGSFKMRRCARSGFARIALNAATARGSSASPQDRPTPQCQVTKEKMHPRPRFSWRGDASLTTLFGLLSTAAMLSGCNTLYSESATAGAGIAGAAVAGSITNNAAVATGIGLGVVAAAKASVQYTQRVVHANTQDQIAKVAGPLDVGAVAAWSVSHSLPIESDERGRVTVSRTISSGVLDCKEIVFSVDTAATKEKLAQSAFYVASICRDGAAWKWASAEPATGRWGALQ